MPDHANVTDERRFYPKFFPESQPRLMWINRAGLPAANMRTVRKRMREDA